MSRQKRGKKPEISDRQIDDILHRLQSEELTQEEAEREIRLLRRASRRVIPRLIEWVGADDVALSHLGLQIILDLESPAAANDLLRLLRDPARPDSLKLRLIPVITALDESQRDEDLFAHLADPEAAIQQSRLEMVERLATPVGLSAWLELMDREMPAEIQAHFIQDMARLRDPRLFRFLRLMAHSSEARVAQAALTALIPYGPAARKTLEEVAESGAKEALRKQAKQTLKQLPAQPAIAAEEPALGPLYGCFLSPIDGDGGQVSVVIRYKTDDSLTAFDVMFNDHEGIKDCFGLDDITEDEADELLDEFDEAGIATIEVLLPVLRQAVEDGCRQTLLAGRQVPLEFFAWDFLLAGDDPRRLEVTPLPPLSAEARPALLEDCVELIALDEFSHWFFNPEEVEEFADEADELLDEYEGEELGARLDALLIEAVKSLVDAPYQAHLRDRLIRQAWLLAQLYEELDPAQWAQAAADALAPDSGVAVEQHPLLLEMMRISLENVLGIGLPPDWDEEEWDDEEWGEEWDEEEWDDENDG